MKLRVKRVRPDAALPVYASAGAACFDLRAYMPGADPVKVGTLGQTFDTGLAFEIPVGRAMLIFSRGGHGFNHATRLANCVGVIDSDYRGEVRVRISRDLASSDSHPRLLVNHGDRIAQAMVVPIQQVTFELADELKTTTRGTGGFGSTGA